MSYNYETKMYDGFIYFILNDINPDLIYVGQTTQSIEERWFGHYYQMKNHTPTDKLHNMMCKYGKDHFAMEAIQVHSCKTLNQLIERLNEREIYYVKKFDTFHNGLNATLGGRSTSTYSRPVKQYSLTGELLNTYESVKELQQFFSSWHSIYDCCYGNVKYTSGYIWRFIDDPIDKYPLPNNKEIIEAQRRVYSSYPIKKYDYFGNLIHIYKDVDEAALYEDVARSRIMKCCTGQNVYLKNHVFRFYNDNFDTHPITTTKPLLVVQLSLNNEIIKVHESTHKAADEIGVSFTTINRKCKSTNNICKGFIWKYLIDVLAKNTKEVSPVE